MHVARPRLDRRAYVASFGVKLVALRPLRTEEPVYLDQDRPIIDDQE